MSQNTWRTRAVIIGMVTVLVCVASADAKGGSGWGKWGRGSGAKKRDSRSRTPSKFRQQVSRAKKTVGAARERASGATKRWAERARPRVRQAASKANSRIKNVAQKSRPTIKRIARRMATASSARTRVQIARAMRSTEKRTNDLKARYGARVASGYAHAVEQVHVTVRDPSVQRAAIAGLRRAVSLKAEMRKHAGQHSYRLLTRLARARLGDGRTLQAHLERWAQTHAPYLAGTSIVTDPAGLVAYGLIAHPRQYFIEEMRVFPGPRGESLTAVEALSATGVGNTEQILALIQDLEDLETITDGELDMDDVEVAARRLEGRLR